VNKVLFLAYYFPPVGGAGVQRALKYVKYLPEEGYLPIVITGPGLSEGRWEPRDNNLLDEIPYNIDICRIAQPPPISEKKITSKLRRWLSLPSDFSEWWISNAKNIAAKACQQNDIKVIFATMSPFESAYIAMQISAEYRIPWVADLRDPWALDEMQIYPSCFHRRVELNKMHKYLSTADVIIMNTPEAVTSLKRQFSDFHSKRIAAITNGYDIDDFKDEVRPRNDDKFRIVHSGYLHTESGIRLRNRRHISNMLGGVLNDVDVLTRSHVILIRAIEKMINLHPAIAEDLEILFIGSADRSDKSYAITSSIYPLIKFSGYLTHKESIAQVRTADLLFLPMHNLPVGKRSTIVPGKTYEYIASGRPIMAAIPEGDAKDILERCGTALICRPDDELGMIETIMKVYEAWKCNIGLVRSDKDYVMQYERRYLTHLLAKELDNTLKCKS